MNELRELLERGAGDDPAPFDADDVHRRFQWRRRRRAAAGSLAVLVALGVAVGLVVRADDDHVVTDDGQADVSTDPADLFDRDWVLDRLTVDDLRWAPPADFQVRVGFDASGVHADVCNGAGGQATYGPGTIEIEPPYASTAMGCPGIPEQAEGYLRAGLPRMTNWEVDGDGLALSGNGVSATLHVERWTPSHWFSPYQIVAQGSEPDGSQWQMETGTQAYGGPQVMPFSRGGFGQPWASGYAIDLPPPSQADAIQFLGRLDYYAYRTEQRFCVGRAPAGTAVVRYEAASESHRLQTNGAPNGWVVFGGPTGARTDGVLIALDDDGRELARFTPFVEGSPYLP